MVINPVLYLFEKRLDFWSALLQNEFYLHYKSCSQLECQRTINESIAPHHAYIVTGSAFFRTFFDTTLRFLIRRVRRQYTILRCGTITDIVQPIIFSKRSGSCLSKAKGNKRQTQFGNDVQDELLRKTIIFFYSGFLIELCKRFFFQCKTARQVDAAKSLLPSLITFAY